MAPGSYIRLFISALILLESQNMIENAATEQVSPRKLFWMYWLSSFARHDSGGFPVLTTVMDNSQPSAF